MEDKKELLPAVVDARGLNVEITKNLKEMVLVKKGVEADLKAFTEKLLKSMEENSIYSYKDDNVTISYVSESEGLTLDTDLLKEKYPDVYEECLKIKHTKASVRITPTKEKKKKE